MKNVTKCTSKLYSFLANNTTLSADNPLRFRRYLLKRISRVIMKIDEKLQYDINKEAAKISSIFFGLRKKFKEQTKIIED